MQGIGLAILVCGLACATASAAAGPEIQIEDVERFYEIYDAANGHPTVEQLQRDYLDAGSDGLHTLARIRNVTAQSIADRIAKQPAMYTNAKSCLAVLPRVRQRLEVSLRELVRLYPQARIPPVTIVVGRGKPVGVGYPDTGLQIGLEALCAVDWFYPNLEDRFVHVIAHEYAHIQQVATNTDEDHFTVLQRSLLEGAAELVAELTSGKTGYAHFGPLTQGREKEIETAFVADQDKTDLSQWLDNSTLEKPGDLGYWVGYRICKAYYQHASDKTQAFRDILEMTDAKSFLAKSGWYPGIQLQGAR
ncbi:hypothetical protein GCM10011487_49060 [Steroidobacter agaridevorans]|uniref:DUF2268 domain-containing protein n=1 Tax=Steroidobacter agaridevorans TaxID=2695856 RepID=A0A829YK67_9GAMM|nr:DUF2268 domain-containing putative Zn-dependent protease [Steroidobacter agaridevorans]GFE82906.1 hypothetical protein GCM10011487_49060 [Steroidobacter agaridevorans]